MTLDSSNQILLPDVIIETEEWGKLENLEQIIIQTCGQVAEHLALDKYIEQADLAVVLTDDKQIRSLNKEYRGKDSPTNALSFPLEEIDYSNPNELKLFNNSSIGDIVISYETLERESREQNKNFIDHFKHLLIHSILHLLGYDHTDEDDAEIMEAEEIKILKKLGINSPYE